MNLLSMQNPRLSLERMRFSKQNSKKCRGKKGTTHTEEFSVLLKIEISDQTEDPVINSD